MSRRLLCNLTKREWKDRDSTLKGVVFIVCILLLVASAYIVGSVLKSLEWLAEKAGIE